MRTLTRSAFRTRRVLVDRLEHVQHRGAGRALVAAKPAQRAQWDVHAGRALELYRQMEQPGPPPGVTPLWSNYLHALSAAMLPRPPWDFLRHPLILETMLIRGARLRHRQLRWLRGRMNPRALAAALEEDPAGNPALPSSDPLTSHSAIQHLFHLERMASSTGVHAGDVGVVVEWGGGFGGFARTLRRSATAAAPTHVIVDLPLIAVLQWTYLSTVLGAEQVELALARGHRPAPGKVTVVPSSLAFDLDVEADLFVSLWGLSETAARTQDAVADRAFFGARHLLLSYQADGPDTPTASRVGRMAASTGARIEPVGVLGHSSYAFR